MTGALCDAVVSSLSRAHRDRFESIRNSFKATNISSSEYTVDGNVLVPTPSRLSPATPTPVQPSNDMFMVAFTETFSLALACLAGYTTESTHTAFVMYVTDHASLPLATLVALFGQAVWAWMSKPPAIAQPTQEDRVATTEPERIVQRKEDRRLKETQERESTKRWAIAVFGSLGLLCALMMGVHLFYGVRQNGTTENSSSSSRGTPQPDSSQFRF